MEERKGTYNEDGEYVMTDEVRGYSATVSVVRQKNT